MFEDVTINYGVIAQFILLSTVSPHPQSMLFGLFVVNFPQAWWEWVLANVNPYLFLFLVPGGVAIITYWVNGLFLLAVDWYVRPDVLDTFKIQQTKQFDYTKLGKIFKNLLFGQFLVLYPTTWLMIPFYWLDISPRFDKELPGGFEYFFHVIVYALTDEVLFFYSHWLMHQGKNYQKYHKMHHEFTAPIGLVAAYSHPLEMFVSNVFPLGFGALIARSHVFTYASWVCFAVLGTQHHHCGYRLPWNPFYDDQPNFHDFHHEKFNVNFGLLGIMDFVHGTDRKWRERLAELKALKKQKKLDGVWRYCSDNLQGVRKQNVEAARASQVQIPSSPVSATTPSTMRIGYKRSSSPLSDAPAA